MLELISFTSIFLFICYLLSLIMFYLTYRKAKKVGIPKKFVKPMIVYGFLFFVFYIISLSVSSDDVMELLTNVSTILLALTIPNILYINHKISDVELAETEIEKQEQFLKKQLSLVDGLLEMTSNKEQIMALNVFKNNIQYELSNIRKSGD